MKNAILFLIGWIFCLSAQANQAEIQHLMAFVQQTACEYERNGTRHSGKDALEHIQKKYDYYEDDIQTTEDFIRLSATKSTMSGKEYWVHCPNKKAITSQQWLLDELNRLRQSYQ
ncbi:MAG: hypothetical protein ACJA1U_000721 [Bermanella sp.]|jgi:hypothetical protein